MMVCLPILKEDVFHYNEEVHDASVLREMPGKERDERRQVNNHEER